MTPDTSTYFIAGLIVIFSGIVIYVVSLWIRASAAQKTLQSMINKTTKK